MYRLRVACSQLFYHTLHSETCIYDIFQNNNSTSCYVFVQANNFFYLTCRGGTLIRSKLHKRDFTWYSDIANQIGSKNKRAIEHGYKKWILVCQIVIDFSATAFTRCCISSSGINVLNVLSLIVTVLIVCRILDNLGQSYFKMTE